ncbi:hypothetical protein RFI_28723 [Reticulomyxa filosa]|uniref:CSN8/PSMD8/EIF3K domain-containing protein n=1 Tax=Reticulomyxa filosa TaxID=46433 RepID=X6M3V7_RETFI|nr:hypothetical protein RFI_28723 [Reticulomyxa filosa]|eukprot:ETO08663.1 hypothetical protein RFI_28723 [Reticulomyxa filosa]
MEIIVKILITSLTNLPNSDFALLVYLISMPQMKQGNKELEKVLKMGRFLEEGDFSGFWKEYEVTKSTFQECKNFEQSIRKYICLAVSWTYHSIPAAFLCDLLQIVNVTKKRKNNDK